MAKPDTAGTRIGTLASPRRVRRQVEREAAAVSAEDYP